MKVAILGVRYDTESAELLGDSFHAPEGYSTYWEAGLYRTPRSGRYFLAGDGGFLTRWRGEEKIIPLSEKEAYTWVEQELGPERARELFKHIDPRPGRQVFDK